MDSIKKHQAWLITLGLAFLVWIPLTDTDVWWHLASARKTLQQASWLYTDPFCYSPMRFDQWVNGHWLFQIGLLGLYTLGGVPGLVIAKLLIWSLLVLGSWRIWGQSGQPFFLLSLIISWILRDLILERPILLSLAMLIFFIACFEKIEREQKVHPKLFAILVLSQFIWTQCQSLFVLGFVLCASYLLAAWLRRDQYRFQVFFLQISLILISLLNPYGWRIFAYPLYLYRRLFPDSHNPFSTGISENIPLWQLYKINVLQFGFGIVLSLWFILVFRRITIAQKIWSIALLILAWQAQRNLLIAGLILVPLFLKSSLVHLFPYRLRVVLFQSSLVLALTLIISHGREFMYYPNLWLSPYRVPVAAAEWIHQHPDPRHLYAPDRYGSYLEWSNPENKTLIDGRFVLKSSKFFDQYRKSWRGGDAFDSLDREYQFGRVLLPTRFWPQFEPLIQDLHNRPQWTIVYADGECAIWQKKYINAD